MIGRDGRWTAETVVVFGAGGMLGRAVCEQLMRCGHRAVALTRVECDVTNMAAVAAALGRPGVSACINCAGFTDVDRAEDNPHAANVVNGVAPGIIARAAAVRGLYLVHVSTDHVFDGRAESSYAEHDYPAPVNAYGASKLVGDVGVRRAAGNHAIIRLQWLYGGHRDFPSKIQARALLDDEPIPVVDDMGAPTDVYDAARAIVRCLDHRRSWVWHYAAKGLVSRADWARTVLELTDGGEPWRVRDVTDAPAACAPRPHRVELDCSKIDAADAADVMPGVCTRPDWLEAFTDYMVAREGGLR